MMPHSNPGKSGVGNEGSPRLKLVLGYEWLNREQKLREEGFKGLFTESQWQELYIQAVIFKYLQSGLPVPLHLVPPTWRSVSRKRSPGLMDGEPWRCRRTDGKRWRCRKRAAPHHKYCETHMHRSANRSRKLVEAAAPSSQSSKSNSDVQFPYSKFLSSIPTKDDGCADSKPSIATQECNRFFTNSLMSSHGVCVDSNTIPIPPALSPAGYMKRLKFNNMNTTSTRTNPPHIFTPQLDGVTPSKFGLLMNPVTVALPPPQPLPSSSMVANRIHHPLAIATRYTDHDDDDGCMSLDTKLSIAPF